MVKSVYIHIPFCKNICSYCDFCKFFYNENWISKYIESLEKEISEKYKNEELNTIYIGGGTPSSLTLKDLEKLFDITNKLKLNKEYEFTMEFNVEDIERDKLKLCKENKVNRISIGIQSFNRDNLIFLERKETSDIDKKIELVKKYFDNINIDLIYALPNQTLESLEKDIDKFLKLNIPHISCYSLILEEHTKLHNKNIKPIDEDLDYEMYSLIDKKLRDYDHYEISNYAKQGYESKHNLTYWNNEEYYGFGVGASGYIKNIRYTNSKNIIDYMNQIYKRTEEKISKEEKMSLELILGFRKMSGININDFNSKYKVDITSLYNIKELLNKNMLQIKDNYIHINKKYLYLSNEILVNFV